MIRFVARQTPLRSIVATVALVWLGCVKSQAPALCDLNEIQPDHGVGKVRLLDGKPEPYWEPPSGEPRLIPCDCPEAELLRPLEFADALEDAALALENARPVIYGEEGLTHVPPGWKDGDEAHIDRVDWKPYPWANDTYPVCFEFERLQPIAKQYYARYNRAVLDGVRAR